MKICLYHTVNPEAIPGYKKFAQAITADNFIQADVRKIDTNLYRARLNIRDRLLFSLYRCRGETVCLVLEYLRNHAYHTSRFIRKNVVIDEALLQPVPDPADIEAEPLTYINPSHGRFHRLDKMLSFDDDQQTLYEHPLPLVIVGSAGSGKTALVLEKMKQAGGDILYLSLSSFLVEKARTLCTTSHEENTAQNIDFLSLSEFLETLRIPEGKEVTFAAFSDWLPRNKTTASLGSAHMLYEEFRGVIGAAVSDTGPMSREDYLTLGIRQSLYPAGDRDAVYTLFERYVAWLKQSRHYDTNLLSHQYLPLATPRYDVIFVDEIQDMTPVQLSLVLKTLRHPDQFLLCGDANQIVHPNFFSWSTLKSLFFHQHRGSDASINILRANYRNASHVTTLANRLLRLKQARFSAIDRESHHLVKSCAQAEGVVRLLEDREEIKQELNTRTARSNRVAVVVMHPEQKAQARRWFNTPLIFSVREAKGLEYETVILYNMVSSARQAFDDICEGITPAVLEDEAPRYARPRDKQDRSAEIYKFFTNALYVALTRATHNVYLVEQQVEHPLWLLLALSREEDKLNLQEEASSLDEWQKTARLLEKQGKQEQADAIRDQILQQSPVPWHIITPPEARPWTQQILTGSASKATQLQALEYSLIYSAFPMFNALYRSDFKPALQPREKSLQLLEQKYFRTYTMNNPVAVLRDIERYGVDHRTSFNLTPLMVAARVGNTGLVQQLIDKGADPGLTGNDGLAAYHHVLSTAISTPRYAQQKSAQLYALLKPESLSLQVSERLIKLDNQHMATFLVILMQALFYARLGNALIRAEAYSAALLADCVAHLPDELLPERRKRQSYISSLLSQHEVCSKNAYGKKLFLRLRRGQYILNPVLKIRQGEDWVPVYQQLSLEDMSTDLQTLLQGYPEWRGDFHETKRDYHERTENIIAYWVGVIRKASKGK
ncbi:TPA: AAA family ATPase [Salmonella enterica subsp. enterica serovar Hvittingfoss]|nr:AAA family ATPase [Salmonella enterica subsp. enterica serovar Hvittingfoss]